MNNCPRIAQNFGSDSRRGKGRIAALCNLFHNTEAGRKDKQDWIIVYFREGQESARALVAQARKRAQLDPDKALELAVEETRAARKR